MTKEERKKYMRDYMRKRYAEKKAAKESLGDIVEVHTVETPALKQDVVVEQKDSSLWNEAEKRAEAARKYASTFPCIMRPSDVKFQSPDWQYSQLLKHSNKYDFKFLP